MQYLLVIWNRYCFSSIQHLIYILFVLTTKFSYEIKVFFKDKDEEAKLKQAQYSITRFNEQIQKDIAELSFDKQKEVVDFILFLRQRQQSTITVPEADEKRVQGIKKSLQKLSKMRLFTDIDHPVDWQRNLRQDRPLPGHER